MTATTGRAEMDLRVRPRATTPLPPTPGLEGSSHHAAHDVATAGEPTKAKAFSEELLRALDYGSLRSMISLGHRTGIFDVMRGLLPSTSEEFVQGAALLSLGKTVVR